MPVIGLKTLLKEDNIQLKTELINSARPVDYVLLEYVEEQKIDLIVVGTRGRTGFKKLLLGSIASSIVTYAHCPVMGMIRSNVESHQG